MKRSFLSLTLLVSLLPSVALAASLPDSRSRSIPPAKQTAFISTCQDKASERGVNADMSRPVCGCMLSELVSKGPDYFNRFEKDTSIQRQFTSQAILTCTARLLGI